MPEVDQLEMTVRVEEILNRRPAVGFALGVVRNGSLQFFQCQGVANIAAQTPVTKDTVFRIASITKTFTGIAVMQLWEQGVGRPGRPRKRLPARVPAGAREGQLAAGDDPTSADPHRRYS